MILIQPEFNEVESLNYHFMLSMTFIVKVISFALNLLRVRSRGELISGVVQVSNPEITFLLGNLVQHGLVIATA